MVEPDRRLISPFRKRPHIFHTSVAAFLKLNRKTHLRIPQNQGCHLGVLILRIGITGSTLDKSFKGNLTLPHSARAAGLPDESMLGQGGFTVRIIRIFGSILEPLFLDTPHNILWSVRIRIGTWGAHNWIYKPVMNVLDFS